MYLAEDRTLHRKVVLKVVSPKAAGDPDAAARLLREARAVAALDHPNICTLYEIGADAGIDYLALQYLQGETLADRIRRGPLPLDEALGVALDLTSALVYAHGRGVLHRDIKPQNIMVLTDGRAKLLDFGIAKTADQNTQAETEAALTRAGAVLGTLEYMAPEALGGNPATAQSDIFSLALVVYELVAGHHPFRADTAAVTVSGILTRNYPPLAPANGPRFTSLDGVLAKALSRDPKMRHATTSDLLVDFERVRRSLVDAEGEDRVPPRRRMWAVATIVVAVASVVYVASGFSRTNSYVASAFRRTFGSTSTVTPGHEATAAPSTRRSVEYWFDVRRTRGGQNEEIIRSLGTDPFEPGSKFRIALSSAVPAFVYLLNDDGADLSLVYPLSSAGSNGPPPPAAMHTSDWFGFSGGAGVERLWIVWSVDPVASLDAVVPSANERDLGIVRDPQQAASIREWLAMNEGHDVAEDRASDPPRVMLSFATSPLVRQITLQHERRSRQ